MEIKFGWFFMKNMWNGGMMNLNHMLTDGKVYYSRIQ